MSTPGSAAAHTSPVRRRRPRRAVAPLPLRVRVRVLLRRASLDSLLVEGADPVTTPELTLRAFQLTRPASRAALGASLQDALAGATERRRRSASAAPLARDAIAQARPELEDLARALCEQPVVSARGVALARRLLTDGSGPLFVESRGAVLRCAAVQALSALRVAP